MKAASPFASSTEPRRSSQERPPILGTVNYHRRSAERQAYHIDPEGEVGRLKSPDHDVVEVVLRDLRTQAERMSFSTDGLLFAVEPTQAQLSSSEEFWRTSYEAELRAMLVRQIGAEDVIIFDHTLRVDDPEAARRPARNVHTDYSPEGARARLTSLVGADQAARWAESHFGFVNVWRPVGSVVQTSPLGFVRPSSIQPDDWVILDLIYPDRVGQIMGLVANPQHDWVMLSAMRPDEVAIFNIFDSGGLPPVAHSAIELNETVPHVTRTSLESRTLVRYRT